MEPASRDYAIVIGVSRYEHLPALAGPARDAKAFFAWLGEPAAGLGLW